MKRLRHKVASLMESRDVHPFFSLATVLQGGSMLYGGMVRLRQCLLDHHHIRVAHLPCAVISIGNLTVGGTGKTPMTIHLARRLRDMGFRVSVVSRGYKGRGEKKGALVSDGTRILCDVATSGDEPHLMARLLGGVPVVVGAHRFAAGRLALERFSPDVIVIDDGFQHQQLARDLNILLLDGGAPLGNTALLPRGRLREPPSALERADVVIFTRCDAVDGDGRDRSIRHRIGSRPTFRTTHRPVPRGIVPAGHRLGSLNWSPSTHPLPEWPAHRKVFAFSGLAHNSHFWESLPRLGVQLTGSLGFDDHHPYRADDIRRIVGAARAAGCNCLITTEKDAVRLPGELRLPLDLAVAGVEIDFGDDDVEWRGFLTRRLQQIQELRQ